MDLRDELIEAVEIAARRVVEKLQREKKLRKEDIYILYLARIVEDLKHHKTTQKQEQPQQAIPATNPATPATPTSNVPPQDL